MLFIILTIVLLIVSAVVVYKSAEAHELHKMRAAFEDKRSYIQGLINERGYDIHNFNYDYYQGELEAIDEIEAIIDEELEALKNFDLAISDKEEKPQS